MQRVKRVSDMDLLYQIYDSVLIII